MSNSVKGILSTTGSSVQVAQISPTSKFL